MRPVLRGKYAAIARNEKIGRQTKPPAPRVQWRDRIPAENRAQAAKHASQYWHPGARIEQGAASGLHAEVGIESFVWISDDSERQIAGVTQQLFRTRVEHNDLQNRGGQNLIVSLNNRMEMEVAHWAARESSKLQMHESLPVRNADPFTMDRQ